MIAFDVNDMTCNHCVRSITEAVTAADPLAQVQADLASHRVLVNEAQASAQALQEAIRQAGYSPVLVDAAGITGEPMSRGV